MDGLDEHQTVLPDVKRMRELQGIISRLYSVDCASLLPSVRQRLGDLVGLVRDADALMSDHVLRGLIILNNQHWEDLPSPGAEAVTAEQAEIAKVLEDDLLRVTARLDTLGLSIQSTLQRMAVFVLPDVEPRVGVLTQERDINGQRMLQASHEQALQKIEQDFARLPGIANVLDWRDQWLGQATIVQQGWTQRLNLAKQTGELRNLATALATLRDYLAAVRRLYEKA